MLHIQKALTYAFSEVKEGFDYPKKIKKSIAGLARIRTMYHQRGSQIHLLLLQQASRFHDKE